MEDKTDISVRGKGWEQFLEDAPQRVVEVIEDGPFPLADYDASKLSWPDKRKGMMRFKGGNGRGHLTVKSGQEAVVYFDPDFCEVEVENIPEPVEARHTESQVIEAFNNL